MKSIVMHAIGVALTFLVSVLVLLMLKGMLVAKPPFVVPPATQAPADSTFVVPEDGSTAGEDAVPAVPDVNDAGDTGSEPHSEYRRSPEDSLTLALRAHRVVVALPDTTGADQPAIDDMPPAADPAKVERLARVYAKMKPKTVAQIMDSLSDENTLAILTTMNDRVAAKVIAGMDPTNAARLSEMMAKGGH